MKIYQIIIFLMAILTIACNKPNSASVEVFPFGTTSAGDSVSLFRLKNASGAAMEVIDYGCRVVRINVPDKNGNLDDVVPGYDNIQDFESGSQGFSGALIGRYANRIANGKFSLDNVDYQLTVNNTPNGFPCHLHGGKMGFDRVMWQAAPFQNKDTVGLVFTRTSPDGEEGYPGNLQCRVTYSWLPDNTWRIEYTAETDKPTIVNLSQHCYFNLKGENGGTILDHYLTVYSDSVTVGNEGYTATGEIVSVENTPYDFRAPHRIIDCIFQPKEPMKIFGGCSVNWIPANVNWVLNKTATKAAFLYEAQSGRTLEVRTTEPGLLIYTGQGLSEKIIGKNGQAMSKYGGLILETIHHPDSPNHPNFPSCTLRPGEKYRSITEYQFGINF
ncbi:MAG: galactose mutarotase [Candidatus Symbiothrix sp.]|jgi:aldose 1-epimerase|nr:galactose mutarotase [Candidatus Symbiothrix sp.]